MKNNSPSRLSIRLMAFLTGINEERPTRRRIAQALKRCERSVKTAIAELVELQWITCPGGGNGTPSTISVINAIDWISARDSKTARDEPKVARDCEKTARDRPCIRVKVKDLELDTNYAREVGIHALVIEHLGGYQLGGFKSGGVQHRAGILPDAGTLARISAGIGSEELWPVFVSCAREALRDADSWGLIVNLARKVGRKPQGKESSLRRIPSRFGTSG